MLLSLLLLLLYLIADGLKLKQEFYPTFLDVRAKSQ